MNQYLTVGNDSNSLGFSGLAKELEVYVSLCKMQNAKLGKQ